VSRPDGPPWRHYKPPPRPVKAEKPEPVKPAVKPKPIKPGPAYRLAACEDDMQGYLARELGRFGWEVIREVSCRPMRRKWRRIDLYATYKGGPLNIPIGFVLGVECKHNAGGADLTEAYNQTCDYITATTWTTGEGTPLPRPDHFVVAITSWLVDKARYDHAYRAHLWNIGASIVWRDWNSDLCTTIRRGEMRKTKARDYLTAKDVTVCLTDWSAERER